MSANQMPSPSQYAELGEDDLIELADNLGTQVFASDTAVQGRRAALELVAVVGALKARREATAPARRRIGEYLRQRQMEEDKRQADLRSEYVRRAVPKEPFNEIDTFRIDPYARTAVLRLNDLVRVVQPTVRDSEADFFAVQERRLAQWKETAEYRKLPAKQQALLECVAKGHIVNGYRAWRGDKECCRNTHGATLNSLISKRHIVTSWSGIGHTSRTLLILQKPA